MLGLELLAIGCIVVLVVVGVVVLHLQLFVRVMSFFFALGVRLGDTGDTSLSAFARRAIVARLGSCIGIDESDNVLPFLKH